MKKSINDEFIKRVKELVGDEYTPLEKYKRIDTKILMRHNTCGYEWEASPKSFIYTGIKCPKCQFIKRVKELVGDEYTPLGRYKNSTTKILMRHNTCGYEWEILPGRFSKLQDVLNVKILNLLKN